jgi:phosphoserine phosphatase
MQRKIRLVVFDLDGTLTTVDSLWKYLHDVLGTWDRGSIAAQKYRNGEITYKDWARADVQCWTGVPVPTIIEALSRIPYSNGARGVFGHLQHHQIKTAIISAGLSILGDKVAADLGADFAIANDLMIANGVLTGEIDVRVSVTNKGRIIEDLARKLSIQLDEVALVGDRVNDLPLESCLKIAYKPKDDLAREKADVIIEDDDLIRILPFLGLNRSFSVRGTLN